MKTTDLRQAESFRREAFKLYEKCINDSIDKYGSMRALAQAIDVEPSRVRNVIVRESFKAYRDLVLLIKERT